MGSILGYFQDQSANSALQDFAAQQYGANSPIAMYAQADPQGFRTIAPQLLQQQQQQNAINALSSQSQQSAAQPQQAVQQLSPLAQYGTVGDSQPNAPIPQSLPDPITGQFPQLAQTINSQPVTPAPQQPNFMQRALGTYATLPKEIQNSIGTALGQQLTMGSDPSGSGSGGGVGDAIQKQASAIANYKEAPPPSSLSQRNPVMAAALQNAILTENPDYDATEYKARQKVATDFSPGGVAGQKLTAVQTAVNHIAGLMDASDKLGGNTNWGPLNGVLNTVRDSYLNASGDPTLKNYQGLANMAGDEVAKAVSGTSGSTESDRRNQEGYFTANQSPDARKAAAQTAVQAMFGKLEPMVDQYNQVYHANKTPADFLSPETQQSLSKLGMLPDNVQPQQPAQPSALAQIAAPQTSDVQATHIYNGQPIGLKNNTWVYVNTGKPVNGK